MPSTPTSHYSNVDDTVAGTKTSTAFTPGASALLLAHGFHRHSGNLTETLTIADTLGTLSWTKVGAADNVSADNGWRHALWLAVAPASPSEGTVSVTGMSTPDRRGLQIVEIASGFDATTPLVQFKVGGGTATTLTVTLDVTPATDSLAIGFYAGLPGDQAGPTEGGDFVELIESTVGTGNARYAVQNQYDEAPAAAACPWSALKSTRQDLGIVVEIAAAGGQTVQIGAAAETDSAGAIGLLKTRAVNQSLESDAAFSIAAARLKQIGLSTETDSAFAVARRKSREIGQAQESDQAFSLSAGIEVPIGLASETDSAFAVSGSKSAAIGLALEADSALAAAASKLAALGIALETDAALAIVGSKNQPIGQAQESDAALPLTVGAAIPVGLAQESDAALAATISRSLALGQAVETDQALSVGSLKFRLIGMASEADAALAISALRSIPVGLAAELDSALAVVASKLIPLGLAEEVDVALAVTVSGGTVFLTPIIEFASGLREFQFEQELRELSGKTLARDLDFDLEDR